MTPERLEAGYWGAYRDFYRWGNIWEAASVHARPLETLRHLAYAVGWKKFEPLWDLVIHAKRVTQFLPLLETLLAGFGGQSVEKKNDYRQGLPNLSSQIND
jgi:hypothetical protein